MIKVFFCLLIKLRLQFFIERNPLFQIYFYFNYFRNNFIFNCLKIILRLFLLG